MLIIAFSPIVSDARVRKQIELFRDDFDVTTIGYGPRPDGAACHLEVPPDAVIWRYPRLRVMFRQYRSAYRRNPAISAARALIGGQRFDVVIANDVDAAGLALETSPRWGVHVDLHEYAPRVHDELLRFRLFVRPFVEWMCRTHVARAASWSTVSAGLAAEYQREFGFEPDLVVNAAPFAGLQPTPIGAPVRLVHSGACLRARSLHLMVEAVVSASNDATLDLYLTPNDPAYLAELRALAAQSHRIRVMDPVPYEDLVITLNRYDVGLFLLPPLTFNYLWALPNKLFDYVQARLGTLVGPSPEMVAYVRRHDIGDVTADFGADSLRRAVESLTPATVAQWKQAAHVSARELSAENQVQGWARAIEALSRRGESWSSLPG